MIVYVITAVFGVTLFCVYSIVLQSLDTHTKVKGRLEGVKDESEFAEGEDDKDGFMNKLRKQQSERKNKVAREKSKKEANNELESPGEAMLDMAEVDWTASQFSAVKVLVAFTGLLVGFFLGSILGLDMLKSMLVALILAIVGMVAPTYVLRYRINAKKNHIREHLPDVMDLLVVSVEAGLGFDASLAKLYEKDKSPLMQEFMQASRDIKRGVSKKEAYENLAKRCDVKELSSFIMAIVQADQMGISIRSILRTQSESLREKRKQRAEEKALKAPVLMLIPLVIFIFPVIFVVLLGPAAMTAMEML
jgi:tight adherence protein C